MKKRYLCFAALVAFAATAQAQYSQLGALEWQGDLKQNSAISYVSGKELTLAGLSAGEQYLKIAQVESDSEQKTDVKSDSQKVSPEPDTREGEDSQVSGETSDPELINDFSLTLKEYIALVREKNERIIAQQLEFEISKEAVNSAWSIFEPEAVASYNHQVAEQNYTAEEQRRLLTTQDKKSDRYNNYNAAVAGLIPTGANISVGYALSDISNQFNSSTGDEFQTDLVAEVTQPLLKGAGVKTTLANINMAEADSFIAFQTYRQQMMQVVFEASSAYWDMALAQKKHEIALNSVKIAEQILSDSRERLKYGKMSETEVLEAEVGFATRQSLELAARHDLSAAVNYLRNFMASSTVETEQNIVPTTELSSQKKNVNLDQSIETSLKYRPDYVSALKKLEREDIRVAYSKNQRWPQLDLKGSYGLNGLNTTASDSFDDALDSNDRFWTVGFELRIPLGGGKQSKSEYAAAKHKKRQALLELQALETSLKNAVHTSVGNVKSSSRQEENYEKVAELKKRLLDVELIRLEQGKSNNQQVLEREEEYHEAQNAHLDSLVENIKSILELELVEGTLLQRFAADVTEEN